MQDGNWDDIMEGYECFNTFSLNNNDSWFRDEDDATTDYYMHTYQYDASCGANGTYWYTPTYTAEGNHPYLNLDFDYFVEYSESRTRYLIYIEVNEGGWLLFKDMGSWYNDKEFHISYQKNGLNDGDEFRFKFESYVSSSDDYKDQHYAHFDNFHIYGTSELNEKGYFASNDDDNLNTVKNPNNQFYNVLAYEQANNKDVYEMWHSEGENINQYGDESSGGPNYQPADYQYTTNPAWRIGSSSSWRYCESPMYYVRDSISHIKIEMDWKYWTNWSTYYLKFHYRTSTTDWTEIYDNGTNQSWGSQWQEYDSDLIQQDLAMGDYIQFKIETYYYGAKVDNFKISTYNLPEEENLHELVFDGVQPSTNPVLYALQNDGFELKNIMSFDTDMSFENSNSSLDYLLYNSDVTLENVNLYNYDVQFDIYADNSNHTFTNVTTSNCEQLLYIEGDESTVSVNGLSATNIRGGLFDIDGDGSIVTVSELSATDVGEGLFIIEGDNSTVSVNELSATNIGQGLFEITGTGLEFISNNLEINNSDHILESYGGSHQIYFDSLNVNNSGSIVLNASNSSLTVENSILSNSTSSAISSGGSTNQIDVKYTKLLNSNGSAINATGSNSDITCRNSIIGNNSDYGIYASRNNFIDHATIFGNGNKGVYTGVQGMSYLKNSVVCLNNNSFNSQTNGNIEVFYSMTSGDPYFSDELGHLESHSDAVDAAMPWEVDAHMPAGIGKVRADMGAYGGPDNAYWGGQPVPDGSPVISSVADIPDDQGGYVGVEFDASIFDGDHTAFDVTHYSFWREMDLDGERSAGVYLYPEIETAGDQHRSGVEANWELVGEMTSNDFDAYGFTAATLADSVDGVVFPNTYVVIAHTLDDDVYWYSDTLSGYSVDNIAPNAPTELFVDMEYTAGRVVWSDPTDFDYAYSNVYRDGTYFGSTTTNSYLDATVEHMQEYEYQISHVDVHSNEGERASEFLLASVAPWTFESTSVNHTVNLPEDLALQMSGEGIQYGDYIGAFIEVDGELICIAQVMWDEQENSIVLHINQTIIGEPIVWVIYDASSDAEYLAQADYNIAYPQNATMLEGGLSQVLEFDINRTQTITIEQGWSMISANVDLGTNDIEDVMSDVSESIFVMKNDMGDVYWPDWSLNTIGDWQDGTGYLMKTSEAGELDVVGQPLHPETTPIVLDEGWNMMAYLPTAASGPEMALESMVDDIIIVKDALGNVYWPYYSLNTMGAMEPGKGYQLKVQNDVVFNYPRIDEEQRPINPVVPLVFYREALNTGSNMTLLIPQQAWIEAPQIGDEIVAYDANSNVVASVVYTGSNQVLTIWGDDVTTEIKEALVSGEAFYLNLWNKETETINKLEVYAFAQGDGTYTENDIQIISSIGTGTQMTAGTLHLKALIPNPSAGSVSIALSNPMVQDLELVIFNSLGEIVFSRESVNYLAGDHVLAIDLDHLESGAYFVKVISDVEMDLLPLQLIK
jgi:hypothetical protein